jgi:hypothetical protein
VLAACVGSLHVVSTGIDHPDGRIEPQALLAEDVVPSSKPVPQQPQQRLNPISANVCLVATREGVVREVTHLFGSPCICLMVRRPVRSDRLQPSADGLLWLMASGN